MLLKKLRNLNHNMLFSVGHQLLTACYGFGLLFILYRIAGKSEVGRWLLITSSVSLLDMIMHGFLQTPVIRKLSIESPSKRWIDTIASNAAFFALCISLLASAAIFALSFILNRELLNDLRWYALLGPAMVFYNTSWWAANGISNFKAVFFQRLVFVLVSAATVAFFIYSQPVFSVKLIIISQFIGYAAGALLGIRFINKLTLSYKRIDRGYLKFFFNYGKYTSGSMLMGSLLRNADIFMIDAFMGSGAVAIYGTAQKTVEIFEVALRGMAAHALPEFCKSSRSFKALMEKYVRLNTKLLTMMLPLAVLMFIFSDNVIHLLSGSTAYLQASVVLKVFMVYVMFLVVDRITGVTLEAMGQARFNMIKTVLLVIVNIAGNAIALYYYRSLAGVAFVSIIAAITGITSGMYFILKYSQFTLRRSHIRTGLNLVLR